MDQNTSCTKGFEASPPPGKSLTSSASQTTLGLQSSAQTKSPGTWKFSRFSHKCFYRHNDNKIRFDLRLRNTLLTFRQHTNSFRSCKGYSSSQCINLFYNQSKRTDAPQNKPVGLDHNLKSGWIYCMLYYHEMTFENNCLCLFYFWL